MGYDMENLYSHETPLIVKIKEMFHLIPYCRIVMRGA